MSHAVSLGPRHWDHSCLTTFGPESNVSFSSPPNDELGAAALREPQYALAYSATGSTKQPQSDPAVAMTSQSPTVGNRSWLGNPDSRFDLGL